MSAAWYDQPAHVIRDAVAKGEVSAVQVMHNYLERIDAVDGQVVAYTQIWRESALKQAEAVDAKVARGVDPGLLAGVPVSLKELFCTTEGKTTCASKILENFHSPYDATVVERLKAAGAVLIGKVNMDEFAMGSSTENSALQITRNPWNLGCVPGGSSGGSAACVAAGMSALSLGSDTGGSIRQPASLCGVVGMKPTYGRISRYGLVAFASSLDQIGPFTRNVTDCARALTVLCGRDKRDATSADVPVPDFAAGLDGEVAGLRIGLPKEFFNNDALDAEVRGHVEAAVQVLEANGAAVREVSLPHAADYAIATYYIICTAEASANLARFDGVRYGYRHPDVRSMRDMYVMSRSEGFGPEVQRRILLGTYVLSSGYYDAYYLKAQKVRTLIKRDFDKAFEQVDVIAGPTSPTPAFKIGEKTDDPLTMYLSDVYTIACNLAALPGLSIPCGLTQAGLPVGLQFFGKPFDEATVLRAAHAYETHNGLDMGAPPIA
ncbi:MAG: Asp-tRNA(Asn)/Glu-tRNA(Gln) amidotransferase subunit GatA [Candidatus Hydrogenedentota bacterium]